VPHAPYFFNAATYGDALKLVDKTIGSLAAHLDERTVLILSADHPLRLSGQVDGKTDPHVPFVLHWPGQTQQLRDESQFSSLATAPLIIEILEGRVNSAEDAMRYLDGSQRPPP
jgi:phosphopentomutase